MKRVFIMIMCLISLNLSAQEVMYYIQDNDTISFEVTEDIFIFNSLGQGVKHIPNPKGETTISISELPKGIYYLKSGDRQQKLIKE